MSFAPVLPVWLLAALAAVVVGVRLMTLYRLLVRTAPGRYRMVVLRWTGLTMAALLLVLAAFRPGLDGGGDRRAADSTDVISDVNVFLVVDRSVTTRVADYGDGEPRMVGIRDDIAALIDEYRGARFDLIGFATQAQVDWPLSQDEWSFRAFVKHLSAYALVPYDAVDVADPTAAREVLRDQLEMAQNSYPKSKNIVFYLGDGASGAQVQPAEFDIGTDMISGGAVLGYGTTVGGPIPAAYAGGRKQYYGDSATGMLRSSALDTDRLRAIATQLGVPYYHRQAGEDITPVLPPINAGLMSDVTQAAPADSPVGRTDWYWILSAVAAGLLLIEIVLMVREYRRNRLSRSDFTAEEMLR